MDDNQQQHAKTNLQFVAFHCEQLMAIVRKLLLREKLNPVEQLSINKAYEEICLAKNLLEKIPEK